MSSSGHILAQEPAGEMHAAARTLPPTGTDQLISDDIIPALREASVTRAQIEQMMVGNPRRFFTRG